MGSKSFAAIMLIELAILGLLAYGVATAGPLSYGTCEDLRFESITFEDQPSELEQLWWRLLPYLDPPTITTTGGNSTLYFEPTPACLCPTPVPEMIGE